LERAADLRLLHRHRTRRQEIRRRLDSLTLAETHQLR
jgi:hypothetical protein